MCAMYLHFILFVQIYHSLWVNVEASARNKAINMQEPDSGIEKNNGASTEAVMHDFEVPAKYFQDIFSEQLAPHTLDFGYVCENPTEWQQRFERNDFDGNHYQGKVKWGNSKGEYGEHYWDLNH